MKNPCGLEWLWNYRAASYTDIWGEMGIMLAGISGNMLCLLICLEVTADSGLEFCHRFHLRIVQRRWKYTWELGPCYLQSWNDRKIRWVSEEGGFKMEWCNTGKVPRIVSFCDFFFFFLPLLRIVSVLRMWRPLFYRHPRTPLPRRAMSGELDKLPIDSPFPRYGGTGLWTRTNILGVTLFSI